ncbi:MAG TPA: nucleoside hydrolase [Anaerolineae bacterium]|nr:nucleoside hydrolase [Anaerolineae bacterium]
MAPRIHEPIKMVGWDIAHIYATLDPQETGKLRKIGTRLAEFCVDIQRVLKEFVVQATHLEGFDLPDPIAMAVALDSAVAPRTRHLFVAIETGSELCRGQTVVDHLMTTGDEPDVEVALEVSRERFLCILPDAVQ